MHPVDTSRTKRARATKAFEEVRFGKVRLYFSHFELIGFQFDGMLPVVSAPSKPSGIDTGAHVEQNRLHLEPDKTKWCSKHDFENKWQELEATVIR